jgi:dUTP pyrophosphatase
VILVKVKFRGVKPEKMTEGSAGFDVRSSESLVLKAGEVRLVGTGLFLEIPGGFEVQVRPRSGLSLKKILIPNSPGTIDSDYRGEVKIILFNAGSGDFFIEKGDRIAQLVLGRVFHFDFEVSELGETGRGAGGFGHTGK